MAERTTRVRDEVVIILAALASAPRLGCGNGARSACFACGRKVMDTSENRTFLLINADLPPGSQTPKKKKKHTFYETPLVYGHRVSPQTVARSRTTPSPLTETCEDHRYMPARSIAARRTKSVLCAVSPALQPTVTPSRAKAHGYPPSGEMLVEEGLVP